jgi:hypothetical protein
VRLPSDPFLSNFLSSPSSANIENLDMKEMYYNKSQKDLTEEKIHHLLSENLFMPRNRVIEQKKYKTSL